MRPDNLPTNRAGIHYILTLTLPDGTPFITSVSRPDQINPIVGHYHPSSIIVDEWHRGAQYTAGPVLGWKHNGRYAWH